jgi:UDP-2,3-diacylglucosamine pyrophosphatase LpxH
MKYLAVSDIHFGKVTEDEELYRRNVSKLIDRINEENPDELILVGDIIDALYVKNFEENNHRDLFFKLIDSCDKVVYVPGNHDIIHKNAESIGNAKITYPFYIKDRIMFIHGHQFDIFNVFPFRYRNINSVLKFVDRFWELCPEIFEEVEKVYADRGREKVEAIKYEITMMRARTFVKVLSRVFWRMILKGQLEEMSASTFTLFSIIIPKVIKNEPFFSQNPGVLDSKMNEYGRYWSDKEFNTICYGHIHRPFVLRGTYFSFINCGYVHERYTSYALVDDGHIAIKTL